MPSEIVFSPGASVKVVADLDEILPRLGHGTGLIDTHRFAGFRGDEAVGAERVIVRVDAIAFVYAITGP